MPRLHAHLLRHTFTTNYLVKEVGDPLRLQQTLGHTSLEMVRRYEAWVADPNYLFEKATWTDASFGCLWCGDDLPEATAWLIKKLLVESS